MKKSYIAFHEERGIYLGVYENRHALFSGSLFVYSSKAIRFDNEEVLHDFFKMSLPLLADQIKAVPVDTTSTGHYVDVIDIIKSGHTKHVNTMIENMTMISESIH
jgi:hypothetical protein